MAGPGAGAQGGDEHTGVKDCIHLAPIINDAHTRATSLLPPGIVPGRDILPQDIHFLSSTPAHTNLSDLLTICTTAVALCLMTALVPAWFAARVDPAVALRDGG
jgi:ABC-type lipoprotein release transport system permease subunit